MRQFLILSKQDISTLREDKPVDIYIDHKHYVLCTDEYYEKQIKQKKSEEEK